MDDLHEQIIQDLVGVKSQDFSTNHYRFLTCNLLKNDCLCEAKGGWCCYEAKNSWVKRSNFTGLFLISFFSWFGITFVYSRIRVVGAAGVYPSGQWVTSGAYNPKLMTFAVNHRAHTHSFSLKHSQLRRGLVAAEARRCSWQHSCLQAPFQPPPPLPPAWVFSRYSIFLPQTKKYTLKVDWMVRVVMDEDVWCQKKVWQAVFQFGSILK